MSCPRYNCLRTPSDKQYLVTKHLVLAPFILKPMTAVDIAAPYIQFPPGHDQPCKGDRQRFGCIVELKARAIAGGDPDCGSDR